MPVPVTAPSPLLRERLRTALTRTLPRPEAAAPGSPAHTGLGVSLPLLIASLGLLLAVSLTCLFTWAEYIKSADQTRTSVSILSALINLISELEWAEASQQSYLLTSEASYLAQYQGAFSGAHRQLAGLLQIRRRQSLDSFVSPLPEFGKAVNETLDSLQQTAAVLAAGNRPAALSTLHQSRAHQALARARQLARRLEEAEQERLNAARTRSRFFARLSELIATLGSAGIFGIVLLSTLRIRSLLAASEALTLRLQRSNEDLQQFAYSASHDLQEPLRNLMIYSDLIERRLAEGALETLTREVQLMSVFAARMRDLLADLLVYTKVVTFEPEPPAWTDLNQVLDRVLENLRPALESSGARLERHPLPQQVPLSPVHAQQLLQNLLSNAVKYRKPGVNSEICISAERHRSEWVVSVSDNGIGIDPRYHAQIFGIFKRLHTAAAYPGTGLGLAICRKIVERNEGKIWVESQLGNGATFRFSIPVSPA